MLNNSPITCEFKIDSKRYVAELKSILIRSNSLFNNPQRKKVITKNKPQKKPFLICVLFFILVFISVFKLINPYKYQTYTQIYFFYLFLIMPNENRFRFLARRLLGVLLFASGAGILESLRFLISLFII